MLLKIKSFYYLCRGMRKIIIIATLLLGGFIFGGMDILPEQSGAKCEISDLHHEQLVCAHRYNIEAERTGSIVIPSARTATTSSTQRQTQQRVSHLTINERFATTTNYPSTRFIHALGNRPRAVDFYLYTLCQLLL